MTGPWRLETTDYLRVFVALSMPEAVKNSFEQVQAELRRVLPEKAARWTRREQLHLTLRFLGNVETSRIGELVEMAQAASRPFAPLHLSAAGIGFFPDSRFPRVVWVGIRDQAAHLKPLWEAIQTATQRYTTEQPENRFVAHITLARLNRLRRSETEELAKAAKNLETGIAGGWTARQLELMRSELSPQGARHTVLAELPLNGE